MANHDSNPAAAGGALVGAALSRPLSQVDPEIYETVRLETEKQATKLVMIASENYASEAVLSTCASVMSNKYAEGYPGKRYYGGCEFVDMAETLAIDRAKQLFNVEHANVQPHSGTQANMGVYFAALQPGDTILGMELPHGGHLSHGHKMSFSGQLFNVVTYGVNKDTELLDYDEMAAQAKEHKPQIIVVGASAYPRTIDFARVRSIADEVGAKVLADIAHWAGLVAAGLPESRPARRFRVDDHAQDATRSARGLGDVQGGVRQGARSQGFPRHPGRPLHAPDRRQGRVLSRGAQ